MAGGQTTIETAAGRTLTVYDAGDPAGAPILFHHGTPSSGRPYEPHVRLAERQGVRLVSYDRAGYADSSRHAGRSVADVAVDIEHVADALGIERFATWGHSGGGPHALACAALLPGRVAAVATVAGVAPYGADGLDWLAGMGEANVEEFGASLAGEETLRPALEAEALGMRGVTGEQLVAAMRTIVSEVDVAVLRGPLGDHLAAGFGLALDRGVDGWVDDDLAFTLPWGFEVDAIATPALVVQGREDLMVPGGHGDWLAASIPGAEAWLTDGEGHLTLFETPSVERIHEWLLARP
ncbi:MAG: alpha/beta hydrolase [Actinobacteria bacterium]|nr:alpha/beta hydrolase [Actinomycetota bacterium]